MDRIAIIIGKMNSGGKKNLIMEYYRHIDKTQFQFDFICDSDSQAIAEEEIKNLDGRVYIIRPYQKVLLHIHDIRRLCKTNHYRIVHAFNNTLNIFPMFAAKLAGVPIRINESLSMGHNSDKKTIIKKLLRPFTKCFANYYFACGEDCGRWQFGEKTFRSGKVRVFKTVINTKFNAYNPKLREKTRVAYGWQDKIVFGFIGRFTAQKNPLFIVDIFNAIVKLEPNAILCLIGDGELRDKMLDKIEKLHLENKVVYFGRREDIQQFYNAMDGFLLPSLFEGLPVVGLEAESCGLPIFFSTEVAEEASACELGHFLSLEKPKEDWAEYILKVVKENMPIRRDRSQDVAAAGFDSEAETKRLQEFYFDALKKLYKNNNRSK